MRQDKIYGLILALVILTACQSIAPPATVTPLPRSLTASPTLAVTATAITLATETPTAAPTNTRLPQPTLPSPYSRILADVTYCTVDGQALKLDLYLPLKASSHAPVVLNVHGGSWSHGDKKENETSRDFAELALRGYIVAAVNYRHAPANKFPAQIQDVKCAVRFLRANANQYNIDSNRIGAFGCSAGGHLVAMLGLADPAAGFDTGEYPGYSSRVQAVIAMSAPTDLMLYNSSRLDMLEHVFGVTSMTDPLLTQYSPVHYITKNAPPFLIITGDKDSVVPMRQSQELFAKLEAHSARAQLLVVQNGDHCLLTTQASMMPTRDQVTRRMVQFFDQALSK